MCYAAPVAHFPQLQLARANGTAKRSGGVSAVNVAVGRSVLDVQARKELRSDLKTVYVILGSWYN